MTSAISGITNAGSYYTGKTSTSALAKSAADKANPAEELVKYSQMSVADKIRYKYLRAHNMTEESLKAMLPDEQKKVEQQIADEIKRSLKADGRGANAVGITLNMTI